MRKVTRERAWRFALAATTALAMCAAAVSAFAEPTASAPSAGNNWHRQMMRFRTGTANQTIKDGVIAKAKIVNANGSAAQQKSQIESLIHQARKAIAAQSAATAALDGVVERASEARVVAVSRNGLVSAPCACKVADNVTDPGKEQAEFVATALRGKGNIPAVRGGAGNPWDIDNVAGVKEGLKNHRNIKIVATVRGDWTQGIARKVAASILSSLPPIQAVMIQGHDGQATYEAFEASGRKIPMIAFGDRYRELEVWSKPQEQAGGYYTLSPASPTGVSPIAFRAAQAVLAGVPKNIAAPAAAVHQDGLQKRLSVMKPGDVAGPADPRHWVGGSIKANPDHAKFPTSPPPGRAC